MIELYLIYEDTGFEFLFCLWNSLSWELFIGPPWLERETWNCESPVPVSTGTTDVPGNKKGRGLVVGLKTFPNQQPQHPKLPEEAGRQGCTVEGGEREKG